MENKNKFICKIFIYIVVGAERRIFRGKERNWKSNERIIEVDEEGETEHKIFYQIYSQQMPNRLIDYEEEVDSKEKTDEQEEDEEKTPNINKQNNNETN